MSGGSKKKARRKARQRPAGAAPAVAAPPVARALAKPAPVSTRTKVWPWPSVFIAGFLLMQIALPIEYYGCRQDRYDERFAWRMFSPERMTRCVPVFTKGAHKTRIILGSEFHQAWQETAKRGRIEVITRMAEALCERNPGEPIQVQLRCVEIDGTEVQRLGGWDMCGGEAGNGE
jgi:hypothetical protein